MPHDDSNPLIALVDNLLVSDRPQAVRDLRSYFEHNTGRYFEHYSSLGDPMRFDANDFAAVATLSVPLEGRTVAELTERTDELAGLLARLPARSATVWASPPSQTDAATELYDALRGVHGLGYVRTSKLLASKRPHLIPIRDSVTETLLGTGPRWWWMFEQALGDASVRQGLREVAGEAGSSVPESISILRTVDVLLWKLGTRQSRPR